MLAVARLAEQEVRPATYDVLAVGDEKLEVLDQAQFLGPAVHDREHDDARALLQVGVLVEVVQHHFGLLAALEVEHDAHAVAVALVANVADALDLLLVDEIGSLLDQARLVDLIGNLADDDRTAILGVRLDLRLGAHDHVAAPFLVRLQEPGPAADDAPRGKVRTLHHRNDALKLRVGMLDELDRRIDQLAEIVRRDVGCHAHGDAVRTVYQQVRSRSREVLGLFRRVVVVRPEVHRVHVDVFQQRFRVGREARLGVAHGRRRVAVDRAEVPLAGDQQLAHAELLRHADQGVVNRRVAVRMVLAHHLADDASALARRSVRAQALLAHGVQDAPLHGLETVADIGQRSPDDDRHRVVEIRLAHLVFDIDRLNVRGEPVAVHGQLRRGVEMVFCH